MKFKGKTEIWRFFQSRKFTLIILIGLLILIFAGVLIPQKNVDYNIFSAWYFYLLAILLFVNTMLCSLKQVRRVAKINAQTSFNLPPNAIKTFFKIERGVEYAALAQRISQSLTSWGYQTATKHLSDPEAVKISAQKGQGGRWGIVVFHLSFLVILGSVFYGNLTRMEGVTYVGVGQTFTEREQDYFKITRGLLFGENQHLNFQMTLDKVKARYSQGYPDVDDMTLIFRDQVKGTTYYQGNGENISYRGIRIFIDNMGFAPALVFTDGGNQLIYGTFKKIQTEFHTENRVTFEDQLDVPALNLKLFLRFLPDAAGKGDKAYSKSAQPKNPLLYLRILSGNRQLFDGTLKTGAKVKLADNLFLNYPEYRMWVSFRLVRDISPVGIFPGFFMGIGGLALYYLMLPGRFLITIEKGEKGALVKIAGHTEKFKEVFKKKFEYIVKKIRLEYEETGGEGSV